LQVLDLANNKIDLWEPQVGYKTRNIWLKAGELIFEGVPQGQHYHQKEMEKKPKT